LPAGRAAVLFALGLCLFAASEARAQVSLTRVSTDPYVNPSSQHETQVEPDTLAWGTTMVATFQTGRFADGGASNAGWATTTDGGTSWSHGFLPGTTTFATPAGAYDRVSDPVVAYDAKHGAWLIATLAIAGPGLQGAAILINRSVDGGLTWGNPVVASSATGSSDYDKNWVVCDNTATSPHYGNCYLQWDDFGDENRIDMSTSTDGGVTWGTPQQTAGAAVGIGGQPVVQPNGTVIVPMANADETGIVAFHSSDGGASWSAAQAVATVPSHTAGGGLRTSPLPSAEIDGSGTVYVAWQDCHFEPGCSANDIVWSSSADGTTWSAPARIPIDPVSSGVDHFIPGLAVDPASSGAGARLGLTYHYYPDTNCTADCQLYAGYVSSVDAGANWSAPLRLAGPMSLDWIASTTQGPMVGDYISTSFLGGTPRTVIAVATAPSGPALDEAMYATSALPLNHPPASSSNAFGFGKLKLNKKKGTATQVVDLPGPGALVLSGIGVEGGSQQVGGGSVKLAIVPVGKKKQQVRRKHRAKLRIDVTFTPQAGLASTQSKKLMVRIRRK
jgi:hypothetical protein